MQAPVAGTRFFCVASRIASVALFLGVCAAPLHAQNHPVAPMGERQARHVDSGERANPGEKRDAVFASLIHTPNALWTRLYFSAIELEAGSAVRFTSLLDGEVQELDAAGVKMWSNASAYFNGELVLVEIVAAPGTRRNRIVLSEVDVEIADHPISNHCTPPLCGICGSDTREPSNELWAGRLAPTGCSASIYNPQSCAVSAGHCMGNANVIQFNVPNSTPGCNTQQPPVDDQFPIIQKVFQNAGVGADWAVFTVGTNNLGQTPYDRYGEFMPLADSVSGGGAIEVYGYGISENCILSQTQQLSTGDIVNITGSAIQHNADTTCGNSGSNIVRDDEIIGVVTHCGCPSGSNVGTRIDLAAFVAARDDLCGIPVDVAVPADYPTIQAAINDVTSGSTITVAPGTYFESINFFGKNVTVVSSGGPEATIIDAGGGSGSVARFSNGETGGAVLDGFTLQGGTGSAVTLGTTNYILGGGIYAAGSSPTIRNCIIKNNVAQFGGGMFNNDASPTVENCVIEENASNPSSGGGVFNFNGAAPSFTDTLFINNSSAANGGAMSNQGSNPIVTNCTFVSNEAQENGGAIRNIQSSAPQFMNCSFENNAAGNTGGAFFNDASPATSVSNSSFCGNSPNHTSGAFNNAGGNTFESECPDPKIPGDLNGDGEVGVADLLILLAAWGPCPDCPAESCPADLDGDCEVGVSDLLILLANWG